MILGQNTIKSKKKFTKIGPTRLRSQGPFDPYAISVVICLSRKIHPLIKSVCGYVSDNVSLSLSLSLCLVTSKLLFSIILTTANIIVCINQG